MIDIYGIGNALVDIEIKITDKECQTLGLDKGHMSLIDETQLNTYLNQFKARIEKKASGGSAANTIVGAQQLGASCFYSCHVANDKMGEFYLTDLVEQNVSTNINHTDHGQGQTGICLVFVTPDAERTMLTFLGNTALFCKNDIEVAVLKQSKWLYIEGYLTTSESSLEAAQYAKKIAKENNVKTALTFSDPNIVAYFKNQLNSLLEGGVDFLFANEEEALTYAETDNLEVAIETLQKLAPQFALTLGSKGALIVDHHSRIQIPAYPTILKDTTGAGDCFAGGLLAGNILYKNLEKAGKLGSLSASKVIEKFGPRLDIEQVKQINQHNVEVL